MDKSDLEKLVREERNQELKAMLQNTEFSELTDDSGMTLMHLAAKHNNLELLRYLLSLGFDVNAKSITGTTALAIATLSDQFEAMKILLQSNANIFGVDTPGTRMIDILMRKFDNLPVDVVSCIAENYKSNRLDRETKAEIVARASGSTLQSVISVGDGLAAAVFLHVNENIGLEELSSAIELFIKRNEEENVKMFIQLMPYHTQLDLFAAQFDRFFDTSSARGDDVIKSAEFLLKRMVEWNIINRSFIAHFGRILAKADKETVERFLNGHLDECIRNKFGIETLVALFGNSNVNAIELIKNRAFIIHGKDMWGNSALHLAVQGKLEMNVRYLLDIGADLKAKNNSGETPLYTCTYMNCGISGILLLQYGADIQYCLPRGIWFENISNGLPSSPALAQALVAQLAVDDARGIAIGKRFRDEIISNYSRTLKKCLEQIEDFKKHEILNSVSLFTVLTAKTEDLARRLHGEDCSSELEDYCQKRKMHAFYDSTLKFKLDRALKMNVAKSNLAKIVSQKTGILVGIDNLIIEKIFSFLTFHDILQLI